MSKGAKQTRGGLYIPGDVNEPLPPNAVRYDFDVDVASGKITQTITRGPTKDGEEQEPVVVVMTVIDLLEIASQVQLQSIAFMREMAAKGAELGLVKKG